MGKLNWYKRDPNKALAGMMILSLEERGAYNTVLDLIYAHDGGVMDDDHFIAGWCRVDIRIWRRIKARLILLEKLYVDGQLLRNSKADAVVHESLERIESVSEANRIKGIKSGIARSKNKELAEPKPEPAASTTTTTTTTTIKEGKKESTALTRLDGGKAEFDGFWEMYPHKVDKKDALKAFEKARKSGVPLATIMDGLASYITNKPYDWPWKGPAAWLRAERWNDKPATNHGVGHGRVQTTGNIIPAADNLIDRIREIRGPDPVRSGENPPVVRLLPKG